MWLVRYNTKKIQILLILKLLGSLKRAHQKKKNKKKNEVHTLSGSRDMTTGSFEKLRRFLNKKLCFLEMGKIGNIPWCIAPICPRMHLI